MNDYEEEEGVGPNGQAVVCQAMGMSNGFDERKERVVGLGTYRKEGLARWVLTASQERRRNIQTLLTRSVSNGFVRRAIVAPPKMRASSDVPSPLY